MYRYRYFERYIFGYIKMVSLEIYVLYCFKHTNMLYMIRMLFQSLQSFWRHNHINWPHYISNWQLKCESQIAVKRPPGVSLFLLLGWVVERTTWVVLRVGVDTFTYGFTLVLVISKPMQYIVVYYNIFCCLSYFSSINI